MELNLLVISCLAYIDVSIVLLAIVAFVLIGLFLTSIILFTKAKLISQAPCKIFINNNDSMTKEVSSGSTLLDTLSKVNIAIPSPCGGKATCKQCKVQVLKGGEHPLETEKSSFSHKNLLEGWRLSCQFKVKNDIQIHLPEHLLSVKEWKAKVISNENVATFIKELIVQVPEEIPYESGGYLQIHVPSFKTNTSDWKSTMEEGYYADWEKFDLLDKEVDFSNLKQKVIRAYSMASYPKEGKTIKFNIRIATPPFINGKLAKKIPWGICSSYTFSLKPGDDLLISGPYGESFMINDDRELIFLIGGAGSSFGRSHILHLFYTEKTKRKVAMWYGARSLKENIYQEEYENLDKEHENFSYHLALSDPLAEDFEKGWPKEDPIKTNYLFKAFEEGQLKEMNEPEEALYYVCGPPLHNKSVMKLLEDYGVSRENIVLDDFGN